MQDVKNQKLKSTVTERRRHTRNSIYRFIYNSAEPVSRQEISGSLNISLPTVHQNITELLNADLIRAGEIKQSTGGRPPIGYEVNPGVRYSLGINISSNHFRFWAGNLKQQEIAYKSIRIPNAALDEIDSDALMKDMDAFFKESKIPYDRLLGISIAIPGIFDPKSETIVLSPTLKLKNFNLSDFIKKSNLPVCVMNDSTCAGFEERRIRETTGQSKDFVYLLVENGVGGSAFIDGKQLRGKTGHSCEFGHMRIVPDGRMCNCGQRGCLEAYCSALRITRDLGISLDQFFDELNKEHGKGPRTALFYDILYHLAIGIINLRMAFDCDIVIGGIMADYMGPYLDYLKEEVGRLDPFGDKVDYLTIASSSKAAIKGAAWYHVSKFLNQI
ncbi:MAG: ROK family transcriptional regulator [Lachnospiraceae bacterium]|uniref:ROK family transcriptional regulator n=1 Tax=Candidatus Weimeria bifida TaxID=2599074 RepID=A0A6N7J2A6_9FIRM|nr:ROK family transcriptional regulator [Candidatus Weimeria bifida]RRF97430.1 MAG: ROK family transcriptional regulator [Lachnospiraceae bacterium]